ncbi:MAG TPA: DUF4230 domain-containing protein [Candidatus Corynebacterium gallistercoris]|uniref:DUF4230 domain-containing protein n=1 Tax=Candidatus Corynebacterium gallistercoris TaxID=2838530 RepID=A0A9D1RYJ3_9CORY|nr:DUF4230 domain-containing protein [Candidatus Corynebacterium gallistercoris]
MAIIVAAVMGFLIVSKIWSDGEPKRTITSTGIGGSFEDIAELAVEQYSYSNVGRFSVDGYKAFRFTIPLTGKNFLIAYDGVVKSGLKDVQDIAVDIKDDDRTISIKAPKSVVLSNEIEPSSVVVYDQSFNPINQLGVDDLTEFLKVQEGEAEKKATEKGLLDRANKRVTELLESQTEAFIEGTDKEGYEIQVKLS